MLLGYSRFLDFDFFVAVFFLVAFFLTVDFLLLPPNAFDQLSEYFFVDPLRVIDIFFEPYLFR